MDVLEGLANEEEQQLVGYICELRQHNIADVHAKGKSNPACVEPDLAE